MNYRIILLLLILVALISPVLAGAAAGNFTKTIDSPEKARYNQSYMIATQQSVSLYEWLFLVTLGLSLFLLSLFASVKPENNQIDAIMAALGIPPLLVSALTCTSIDVVTGYGVAAQLYAEFTPVYTLMENHTIYHFDLTGIVLWIFFAVSVLNLIRILLNHRRYETMFTPYGGQQQ